jgi:hypothetical protein
MTAAADIHLVMLMAVRIHWALAALAAAAVSEIEGVQHAMTWYEHDPERTAEFANSWFGSVLLVVRSQKYRSTQHPVVLMRQVREAGSSGYVDPPDPPCFRDISNKG